MSLELIALDYLSKGFSIIPIKGRAYAKGETEQKRVKNSKRPLVNWEEFQNRLATPEEVKGWFKEWPDANIAAITGPISNLFILDLDGEAGKISTAGKEIRPTWSAKTPRDGIHYYFNWSKSLERLTTTKSGILLGVDVRGDGGYVILPPSVGYNGAPYSWFDGMSDIDLPKAEVMPWVIEYLPVERGADIPRNADAAQKTPIETILTGIKDGAGRDDELTRLAGFHHGLGMSPKLNLAYLRLANQNFKPPKDDDDLQRIVKSVGRYQDGEKSEKNSRLMESIPLADFMAGGESEIDWCIDGILPAEGVGILGGWSGWGKTWLLLDLAIEKALGGRWLGQFESNAGRVLYIDEEGTDRLNRKRLKKLLSGKGLEGRPLDIHFCISQGLCFTSPKSELALRAKLQELKPSLVIIDALIRVHRGEENSASEMAAMFRVVKAIVRDFKCSILFADHQRKQNAFISAGDQQLRGTGEKTAFVDSLISLQKKNGTIYVEHSKSRFAEAVPSFAISIEDNPAKTTTTVKYLGEAAPLKESARLGPIKEFLSEAIAGDWVSRQTLIDKAKEKGFPERLADAGLQALLKEDALDIDKRRPETGPGGKKAYYRKKGSNNSFHVSAPIYTGKSEKNSEAPPAHPDVAVVQQVFNEVVRP